MVEAFLGLLEEEVLNIPGIRETLNAAALLEMRRLNIQHLGVASESLDELRKIRESQEHRSLASPAQALTFWLNRPGSIAKGLVGRKADLERIKEAFKANQAVALAGGAGVGKSRLAAEYTHLHGGPQGFWSTAGTGMTQTLTGLAESLGIDATGKGDRDVALEVRRKPAGMTKGKLWAVDNLPDLALVSGLLDVCGPVRLMVTSRDQRRNLLPGGAVFIPLDVLEEDAAVKLLCSRGCTQPDNSALKEIAKAVGYLPLALEMLAY